MNVVPWLLGWGLGAGGGDWGGILLWGLRISTGFKKKIIQKHTVTICPSNMIIARYPGHMAIVHLRHILRTSRAE